MTARRQLFFPYCSTITEFHALMDSFHLYLYGPSQGPIETSFEEASERLERLSRLHLEPDGSFVWTPGTSGQQVFGVIYDAAGKIRYCDLRGSCDYEHWRTLCAAIAGDADGKLEVLILPDQQLQDLQSFEKRFSGPDNPDNC